MSEEPSLDDLWEAAPVATERFDPARVARLPEPARRYLRRALAPGVPLHRAVRLRMAGELRLGGTWRTMEAEQVTVWDKGFRWQARVRLGGLPVTGFDRWLDGEGAMRWRLLGVVPVATGDGVDVSRSAAGRMNGEVVWLPGVLLDPGVTWAVTDDRRVAATLAAHGETTRLLLAIDDDGALTSVAFSRWGDADGAFHDDVFGGRILASATFDGIHVPTRMELGWWPDTLRFEDEGAFFRATVTEVAWR